MVFDIAKEFNFNEFRIKKSKYVYFITDFNNNTKIGRSDNPVKRASEITTQSNKLCFPIFIGVPYKNGNECEKVLHAMFQNKRLKIHNKRTEWFAIETYKMICLLYPSITDYFKFAIVWSPKQNKYVPLFQGMIELGCVPAELKQK